MIEAKEKKVWKTRDGSVMKPLYIRNFSLPDWELVKQIQAQQPNASVAGVIRWALRRAAGKI